MVVAKLEGGCVPDSIRSGAVSSVLREPGGGVPVRAPGSDLGSGFMAGLVGGSGPGSIRQAAS